MSSTARDRQGHPAAADRRAHYTPCFDWVVRATGSSSTALAYGVIWRYAQMRGRACYASCARLAGELGWSRQRTLRHIHALLAKGLVVLAAPACRGVPHHYLPVPPEVWRESHDLADAQPPRGPGATGDETQPVTACDTPCDETCPPAVTKRDPNETMMHTNRRPSVAGRQGRPESEPPREPQQGHGAIPDAIQAVRATTGHLPPRALRQRIVEVVGPQPDCYRLAATYQEWCARGYNPRGYNWLLEWYAAGTIPTLHRPGRAGAADAASAGEFERWREYQESVQRGEDPDAALRRLGL